MRRLLLAWVFCGGRALRWAAPPAVSRELQTQLSSLKSAREAAAVLLARPEEANAVNVAACIHRAAAEQARGEQKMVEPTLYALCDAASEVAPQMRGRQLANTAQALAKLDPSEARDNAARAIAGRIADSNEAASMKPGELSMASWGCATLYAGEEVYPAALLALAKAASFRSFAPKEAVNLVWALAHAREGLFYDEEALIALEGVLEQLGEHVKVRGEFYSLRDVATAAWASAKLYASHWRLESSALVVLEELERVFCSDRCVEERRRPHTRMPSRDTAMTVAALAAATYDSPRAMQTAHAYFLCADDYTVRDAADLLHASARLDRPPPLELYKALLMRCAEAHNPPVDALASALWAAAAMAHESPAHEEAALAFLVKAAPTLADTVVHLRPVHHAILALRACGADVDSAPLSLRRAAREAWSLNITVAQPSKRHEAVSKILHRIKTQHKLVDTLRDEHGDLSVDVQIITAADADSRRRRIALEFDGPSHFSANTNRPLGHTLLKRRLLTSRRWEVVSIPLQEWDRIPYWSTMERARYLQRKLKFNATLHLGGGDKSTYSTLPLNRSSRVD